MNYLQLLGFQLHATPRSAHSLVPGPATFFPAKRGSMVSRARAHTLAKWTRAAHSRHGVVGTHSKLAPHHCGDAQSAPAALAAYASDASGRGARGKPGPAGTATSAKPCCAAHRPANGATSSAANSVGASVGRHALHACPVASQGAAVRLWSGT